MNNTRIPRGLTLMELVVAIAISAMLLTALVGVLRGFVHQTRIAQAMDSPLWPNKLVDILRRDLLSADAIWQEQDTLWIRTEGPTYTGDSPVAVRRTIGYRCIELPGQQWILQRLDDSLAMIAAIGPRRMTLERIDRDGYPQPLPITPGPVPEAARLWIFEEDPAVPLRAIDIILR